ncbi:hypothetical protein EDB89DRAFT_1917355 [Lactarius sanguifluus]|nr:hypothetical protein EDB89DRAFT_1917355 [Lactarius sanguifluus]
MSSQTIVENESYPGCGVCGGRTAESVNGRKERKVEWGDILLIECSDTPEPVLPPVSRTQILGCELRTSVNGRKGRVFGRGQFVEAHVTTRIAYTNSRRRTADKRQWEKRKRPFGFLRGNGRWSDGVRFRSGYREIAGASTGPNLAEAASSPGLSTSGSVCGNTDDGGEKPSEGLCEMSTSYTREYEYSLEIPEEPLVLDSYSSGRVLVSASTRRISPTETRTRSASTRFKPRVRVLVYSYSFEFYEYSFWASTPIVVDGRCRGQPLSWTAIVVDSRCRGRRRRGPWWSWTVVVVVVVVVVVPAVVVVVVRCRRPGVRWWWWSGHVFAGYTRTGLRAATLNTTTSNSKTARRRCVGRRDNDGAIPVDHGIGVTFYHDRGMMPVNYDTTKTPTTTTTATTGNGDNDNDNVQL